MSKILAGNINTSVIKSFTVNQTKPAIKVTWGYYFDGVVGGEYAEIEILIFDADGVLIGNGYKLHNSGPAGIFEEIDTIYRGTPKRNSGNNHSDYGGVPFEAGQVVQVNFHHAIWWNNYKFGVAYAKVEMSD